MLTLRQIIVEDEDGEVVKTYGLPSNKLDGQEAAPRLGAGLKYIGLGGRARPVEKTPEVAAEEGQASGTAASMTKVSSRPWAGFGSQTPRPAQTRRMSAAQQEAADDKNIRFTIGGVNQRMTKEDFIKEVQQLNVSTRKEVVDQSSASTALKRIAKEGPDPAAAAPQMPIPRIVEHGESSTSTSSSSGSSGTPSGSERLGRKRTRTPSPPRRRDTSSPSPRSVAVAAAAAAAHPSEQLSETAVERRRRLAVLATQREDSGDTGETPAERRRREAALGMAEDSDSDDEGEPRVPPARKGIRFAEPEREQR